MVLERKNSSQLTDEDREIINQVVVVCAALFSVVIREYSPKQFAEKCILSSSREKKSCVYLLLDSINKMNNRLYRPDEINKDLSETLLNAEEHCDDILSIRKYLSSSHMSENLRLLSVLGIYDNITDKGEIRRLEKGKAVDVRGGKLSRFKITADVENIKSLISNPEACELLKKKLSQLKVFQKYQKLVFTSLFYSLKKDKTTILNWLRILMPSRFVEGEEFVTLIERLSSIDENQLVNIKDSFIHQIIENQELDKWFIFKLFYPFL